MQLAVGTAPAGKFPLVLDAAHAASHKALRSHGLPARVVPLFRFPPVWLLPGQTPAQLTMSAAEEKASTEGPTSATKVQARRCLMPGTVTHRSTAL